MAEIIQDATQAIAVMHNTSKWMQQKGMHLSEWWQPQNMNPHFLFQHTEPNEFYAILAHSRPAASVVLQESERNQSWKHVDGDSPQKALYMHWLCVSEEFTGQGFSQMMVEFAAKEAKKRGFKLLRLDTDANEPKLRSLYESLGFHLMGIQQEGGHNTAFYQKEIE